MTAFFEQRFQLGEAVSMRLLERLTQLERAMQRRLVDVNIYSREWILMLR